MLRLQTLRSMSMVTAPAAMILLAGTGLSGCSTGGAPAAHAAGPASAKGAEGAANKTGQVGTSATLAALATAEQAGMEVVPVSEPRTLTPERSVASHERFDESGPAPGEALAQVTFAEEGEDFDPAPTPDGTRLVFASTQQRATSDLFIKTVGGSVITQLTSDPAEDLMPTVSPDGSRIAFASNRAGNWDIYVMPIAGGKAVAVTTTPTDELHPSWSPDGTRLVFCRMGETSRRWEMWVSAVSNPATTHFVGYGLFPQWSPVAGTGENGGDKILFQLSRERGARSFGVWTVDYKPAGMTGGTTSNATALVTNSDSALINPTWSPDGKYVVYSEIATPRGRAEINQSKPDRAELWMMSLDGSGRVRISDKSDVALMAAWGPQDRLFFVTDRQGRSTVWTMDARPALAALSAAGPALANTTSTHPAVPAEQASEHAAAEGDQNE